MLPWSNQRVLSPRSVSWRGRGPVRAGSSKRASCIARHSSASARVWAWVIRPGITHQPSLASAFAAAVNS